ncbi:MAG: sulfatase [bacterium]
MAVSRRDFIHTVCAGAGLSALSTWGAEKQPNILLILADQHRGMDLRCAGNSQIQTPNLDRLAREGVFFDNAIAHSPLCTPSRAILLTGKYPIANGCVSNDLLLPTGQPTLATVLTGRGYRSGYIGKWHLDGIPRSQFTPPGPRRQGFDAYWAAYNCHHAYFEPKYYRDTPELIEKSGYEPDVQTDLAIEFLQQNPAAPFFLMVSYGPPHDPYDQVPAAYKSLYDPAKLDLRPNAPNANRSQISGYYAHITALDADTGRLIQTLEELGIRENTLIVYTSDHGDMLGSHGRKNKQQPWEESIRVPLIFSQPGRLAAGTKSDLLFGTADLAPTLLGLTGAPVPAEMEGQDLSGSLLGGAGPARDSVPILDIIPADQAKQWNGRTWRGVRTRRHTYARFVDADWVLYDNWADPYQKDNLIGRPEHRALRDAMENELQRWLKRMNDPFLPEPDMLARLGLTETWREREAHFQAGGKW